MLSFSQNIRRDVSPPSAAKSRSPRVSIQLPLFSACIDVPAFQPLSTARMPESSSSHIQLPASPPPGRSSHDGDDDYDRSYATQQQSLLIEDQDRLLDGISGTVSTLRQQAGIMGTEILSQVGLLTDLESGVDRSQSRLDRANRRLEEFVRKNKSTSIWAYKCGPGVCRPDSMMLPISRLEVVMDNILPNHHS